MPTENHIKKLVEIQCKNHFCRHSNYIEFDLFEEKTNKRRGEIKEFVQFAGGEIRASLARLGFDTLKATDVCCQPTLACTHSSLIFKDFVLKRNHKN